MPQRAELKNERGEGRHAGGPVFWEEDGHGGRQPSEVASAGDRTEQNRRRPLASCRQAEVRGEMNE